MTSSVPSNVSALPNHVFIILDGNRTYAERHQLSYDTAYREGADAFERVALHAVDLGIPYLTGWILGKDNFTKRESCELETLLTIMAEKFITLAENPTVHERQVKIQVTGAWTHLPKPVRKAIEAALEATRSYTRFHLTLLVNYSGTQDLLAAFQKLVDRAADNGRVTVTPQLVAHHLLSCYLPDVDLMIRTKGFEPHLSDRALAWQMNNAELFFPKLCWPEFMVADFDEALASYQERKRLKGQ